MTSTSDFRSYVSANTLPTKLLQNPVIIRHIQDGQIPPVHVQLNLTNHCNLNCSFCSCSERDKKSEISIDLLLDAMERFKRLGCKSVTITGGGEPLLYPWIDLAVRALSKIGIRVGLVTNGTQFHRFASYQDVVWCRISSGDDREPCWPGIVNAVQEGLDVDWAFSHVLTDNPDWDRISRLVAFANKHKFTHVRLVSDILAEKCLSSIMVEARLRLSDGGNSITGGDDHLVIYQDRVSFTHGREKCRISLLKPVVGADGGIYPCCGVQYAQEPPGRDMVESMRMGGLDDIYDIWGKQAYFNGLACKCCYYDSYNLALELLSLPLCHKEFI